MDSFQDKVFRMGYYLKSLRDRAPDNGLSVTTVDIVTNIAYRILSLSECFREVPSVAPSPEGDIVMLSWFWDSHYLECEVFGSDRIEWFYKNWESQVMLDCDQESTDDFPDFVLKLVMQGEI